MLKMSNRSKVGRIALLPFLSPCGCYGFYFLGREIYLSILNFGRQRLCKNSKMSLISGFRLVEVSDDY